MELIWRNAVLVPWLASCGHGRRVPSVGSSQLKLFRAVDPRDPKLVGTSKGASELPLLSTRNINQQLSHNQTIHETLQRPVSQDTRYTLVKSFYSRVVHRGTSYSIAFQTISPRHALQLLDSRL